MLLTIFSHVQKYQGQNRVREVFLKFKSAILSQSYTIILLLLYNRKARKTAVFRAILCLDNESIRLFINYSITVATRPDPTVRLPSRYQNGVLQRLNGYFPFILCGKIRIFHCVRVVLGNFVIMVLSHSIYL